VKQEVAEKWVKALRSGEYKQGSGALETYGHYCCLGVLCEVAIKEEVPLDVGTDIEGHSCYDDAQSYLPDSVMLWSGVSSRRGDIPKGTILEGQVGNRLYGSLSSANDDGVRFDTIADYIEANWKVL